MAPSEASSSSPREYILIGHPVGHSISPEIHSAAYRALGLPHRYRAVDTPDERAVARQVEAVRSGEVHGANVTVPWKQVALHLADHQDEHAALIGATNVLWRDASGRVVATNTDVPALAQELKANAAELNVASILGHGGAALAAAQACRLLGIATVQVTARRWGQSIEVGGWPGSEPFTALGAEVLAWPDTPAGAGTRARLATSDIIIQATSAGMVGADAGLGVRDCVPWAALPVHALAYDLVYNPPLTPFLSAAEAAGLRFQNGLGMLVGQAALAIELWLSTAAPRDAMRSAAKAAMARRSE